MEFRVLMCVVASLCGRPQSRSHGFPREEVLSLQNGEFLFGNIGAPRAGFRDAFGAGTKIGRFDAKVDVSLVPGVGKLWVTEAMLWAGKFWVAEVTP